MSEIDDENVRDMRSIDDDLTAEWRERMGLDARVERLERQIKAVLERQQSFSESYRDLCATVQSLAESVKLNSEAIRILAGKKQKAFVPLPGQKTLPGTESAG